MVLDQATVLFPAGVVLAAYIIMGLTGFGSALITVPLLAWIWPLPEVVALAIALDIFASALHGGLNFSKVDRVGVRNMLPGMLLGATIGVWLVGHVEQRWPLFLLGLYVAVVGLRLGLNLRAQQANQSFLSYSVASIFVGLIEALFATAGPIIVTLMQKRHVDLRIVRATVPVAMVAAGSIALAILLMSDAIALDRVFSRWLYAAPVAALGVWLGNHFARKAPLDRIRLLMALLLVLSGLSLTRHLWL